MPDGSTVRQSIPPATPAKEKRVLKFAVGTPDRAGAIWRVWSPDKWSDVYIAQQSFRGVFKVSLHPARPGKTASWRLAWTTEHPKHIGPQTAPPSDRVVDEWAEPDEFADGITRAYSIIVPYSELQPTLPRYTGGRLDAVMFVPLFDGAEATEVVIAITQPGRYGPGTETWPGKDAQANPTTLVGRYDRADGHGVWLVAFPASIPPDHRAQTNAQRQEVVARGFDVAELPEPRGLSHVVNPDGHRYSYDFALPDPTDGVVGDTTQHGRWGWSRPE